MSTNIGSRNPRAGGDPRNRFDAIYPGNNKILNFSATSAQCSTLSSDCTLVRVFATQDCFLLFGSNPTAATSTSTFLPGGIIDHFGVDAGSVIAAIQDSTAGKLYITEGDT